MLLAITVFLYKSSFSKDISRSLFRTVCRHLSLLEKLRYKRKVSEHGSEEFKAPPGHLPADRGMVLGEKFIFKYLSFLPLVAKGKAWTRSLVTPLLVF